jgi:hypothetical protein
MHTFIFIIRATCLDRLFNFITLVIFSEIYDILSFHFVITSLLVFGPNLLLKILFLHNVSPHWAIIPDF